MHNGSEDYCKLQNYLLANKNESSGGRIELQPGTYQYPFVFQIPPDVPPTYEGKWGSVRYFIKVTMEIPWALDVVQETQINVTSPFDLNSDGECAKPFVLTKGKQFFTCCCASDPLSIEVAIPVCGYIPGQSIPLTIKCENKSNVYIKDIVFQLVRNVEFLTQTPFEDERSEKDLISMINVGPLPGRKSMTLTKVLDIPPITVPHMRNCSIIKFDYKIEVEAEPSGCHMSLDGEIPIIIGSIGLVSFKAPSAELEMNGTNVSSSNFGWNIDGQNVGKYIIQIEPCLWDVKTFLIL